MKAPKTRNNKTMTESAFWSMIRSALRQKSRWRKPIAACKAASKRKYTGPNKRQLWEYKCNECKKRFNDKDVQVDHIIECGSLKGGEDIAAFIERLFCEVQGLQVLCTTCHNKKTQEARRV